MANEEAVRNYLTAIKNPGALKDESRVNEIEEALGSADDPLERVKLQAELSRVQSVSPEDYEQGFVDNVKEWAEANSVTAEAFLAEGVAEDVLTKAGLLARAAAKATRRSSTRTRVSGDDVKDAIRRQGDTFTTSDIEEQTGASAATVRKYVQELIDGGEVEDLGEDPDHSGRGRPPTLYKSK